MGPERPPRPGTSGDAPPGDDRGDSPGPDPVAGEGPPGGVPEHAARARAGDELLGRALALVRHLRAHCPWDAEQTPRSLRPYLLEEAHETADAVLAGDDEALPGELGDLLLNVAFQVVLAEEREAFDAAEVVRRMEAKMRARHPHVYGDADEPPDWEEMKARERSEAAGSGAAASPLEGLPDDLEPLSRSLRMQQRAASVGFDWPGVEGALGKLAEEMEELRRAGAEASGGGAGDGSGGAGDGADRGPRPGGTVPDPAVEEEVGDLLFAAINVARLSGVHPASALDRATRKFEERFGELARRAREREIDLEAASLEEMEALWREVKGDEDGGPAL